MIFVKFLHISDIPSSVIFLFLKYNTDFLHRLKRYQAKFKDNVKRDFSEDSAENNLESSSFVIFGHLG